MRIPPQYLASFQERLGGLIFSRGLVRALNTEKAGSEQLLVMAQHFPCWTRSVRKLLISFLRED